MSLTQRKDDTHTNIDKREKSRKHQSLHLALEAPEPAHIGGYTATQDHPTQQTIGIQKTHERTRASLK